MKNTFIGSLLVLTLAFSACGPKERPQRDPREGAEPTEVTETPVIPEVTSIQGKQTYNMEVDGAMREFIVYRPENLSEETETPVVFMFHGSGQSGELFYNESQWKEKADEEDLTVVFPTALKYHVFNEEKVVKGGELKEDVAVYQTKWNSFKLPELLDPAFPNQTLRDDVEFTQEMVDFLEGNYPVDSNRFYASGFSNGASFTVRLIVQMSDVFAAFAPCSAGQISPESVALLNDRANDYTDATFQARPVAVIIGELDPKQNYALGDVDAFPLDESAATVESDLKSVYIDSYLSLLGLEDSYNYERTARLSHFTYDQPINPEEDLEYNFVIVEGMKHVYPNGENFPVVAVDLFWPFFEGYSL